MDEMCFCKELVELVLDENILEGLLFDLVIKKASWYCKSMPFLSAMH